MSKFKIMTSTRENKKVRSNKTYDLSILILWSTLFSLSRKSMRNDRSCFRAETKWWRSRTCRHFLMRLWLIRSCVSRTSVSLITCASKAAKTAKNLFVKDLVSDVSLCSDSLQLALSGIRHQQSSSMIHLQGNTVGFIILVTGCQQVWSYNYALVCSSCTTHRIYIHIRYFQTEDLNLGW